MPKSIVLTILLFGAGACATAPVTGTASPIVYEQLGGEAGVSAIVAEFVYLMATDPRLESAFKFTDFDALRGHLEDQVCALTDGPCRYTGRDMIEAHKGLDITNAEFNASVELLQKALRTHDVPLAAQNRLLALLAPMHGDVVHR